MDKFIDLGVSVFDLDFTLNPYDYLCRDSTAYTFTEYDCISGIDLTVTLLAHRF